MPAPAICELKIRISMKAIFFALLFVSSIAASAQQATPTGYYSYEKLKFEYNGYSITDHYISLDKNINNAASSYYISKKPERAEIIQAALSLPSDSFTVVRGLDLMYTIKFTQQSGGAFEIRDLKSGTTRTVKCECGGGAISANRAIEIVSNGYQKSGSGLVKDVLTFNKKTYPVISNEKIRKEIEKLIGTFNLNAG